MDRKKKVKIGKNSKKIREYGDRNLRSYIHIGIKEKCMIIQTETPLHIILDQSLLVAPASGMYADKIGAVEYNPIGEFHLETENVPRTEQLTMKFPFVTKIGTTSVPCNIWVNDIAIGFKGEIISGDQKAKIIALRDIGYISNDWGVDVFTFLREKLLEDWDDVTDNEKHTGIFPKKSQFVKIGLDVEYELYKDGTIVDAKDYFPSLRKEIGMDGYQHQLELRPKPSNTPEELTDNLQRLMNEVYKEGFTIETKGSVWPIGAHIHFEEFKDDTFMEILDTWVADKVCHLNGEARGHWQGYSEYRYTDTHWGWEYRSLPSTVTKDRETCLTIFRLIYGLANDYYHDNEIPLIPEKNDYLVYLSPNEYRIFHRLITSTDKTYDAISWGCDITSVMSISGSFGVKTNKKKIKSSSPIYIYKTPVENINFVWPRNDFLIDFVKTFFDKEVLIDIDTPQRNRQCYYIGLSGDISKATSRQFINKLTKEINKQELSLISAVGLPHEYYKREFRERMNPNMERHSNREYVKCTNGDIIRHDVYLSDYQRT